MMSIRQFCHQDTLSHFPDTYSFISVLCYLFRVCLPPIREPACHAHCCILSPIISDTYLSYGWICGILKHWNKHWFACPKSFRALFILTSLLDFMSTIYPFFCCCCTNSEFPYIWIITVTAEMFCLPPVSKHPRSFCKPLMAQFLLPFQITSH